MFPIVATKEHLWEYVTKEVLADPRPVELFQEVELAQLVEQFFESRHLLCGHRLRTIPGRGGRPEGKS